MEPVLEIKNLVVERSHQVVLEDINFILHKGDMAAIIGPNGGGKTTLLMTILGLIIPKSGSIRVFGQSPESVRYKIGYVPQLHTFEFSYPITVQQMVLTGRLGHINGFLKRYTETDIDICNKAISAMELDRCKDRPISDLSGGEQQRAVIARALAGCPELLVLDEPTVYVDGPTGNRLMTLLEMLKKDVTVLMVTHDIGVLSDHINRIACLNRKLYLHDSDKITNDMIKSTYGCPMELITHGHVPHRILAEHDEN